MPLVSFTDLIRHARAARYALPVLPVPSADLVAPLLRAADDCRAPLVLQVDEASFASPGLMAAVEAECRAAAAPLAVLAACRTVAGAQAALRLGCNALRAAADARAELFAALAALRTQCGVAVGARNGGDFAQAQVELDAESRPGPAMARLAQQAAQSSAPLMAGAPDPAAEGAVAALVGAGAAALDFGSGIGTVLAAALRRASEAAQGDLPALHGRLAAVLQAAARSCIESCGATGRAAAALAACEPWREVEHVVLFDAESRSHEQVQAMLAQGGARLARIPGVRQVLTGTALAQGSDFPLCWLIRFAHPAVVASYRDHPDHVAFADGVFRPAAPRRLSIDYALTRHGDEGTEP